MDWCSEKDALQGVMSLSREITMSPITRTPDLKETCLLPLTSRFVFSIMGTTLLVAQRNRAAELIHQVHCKAAIERRPGPTDT
jgi:hypothetical protein